MRFIEMQRETTELQASLIIVEFGVTKEHLGGGFKFQILVSTFVWGNDPIWCGIWCDYIPCLKLRAHHP